MERVALPFAVAALFFLTMVLPTLRVWRRHGTWPIVFQRRAAPGQRLMGLALGGLLIGVLVWSATYASLGPEPLGIVAVPSAVRGLGWLALGLGALIVTSAQAQMRASWRIGIDDRRTELVTTGLFSVVRNPIFSGLLLGLGGVALVTPSVWSASGFLLITTLIALQTRLEELHLTRLHGSAYRVYASRVGRFVPLVGRLRGRPVPLATEGTGGVR